MSVENFTKCSPIIGMGVRYASVREAGKALFLHPGTISRRCASPTNHDWHYINEPETEMAKPKTVTTAELSRKYKTAPQTVCNWLRGSHILPVGYKGNASLYSREQAERVCDEKATFKTLVTTNAREAAAFVEEPKPPAIVEPLDPAVLVGRLASAVDNHLRALSLKISEAVDTHMRQNAATQKEIAGYIKALTMGQQDLVNAIAALNGPAQK